MKFRSELLLIFHLFLCGYAERVRYDHYKVLSLKISTPDDFKFINKLKSLSYVNFLGSIENNPDILISPRELKKLSPILKSANISSEVLIDNIQEIIDEEEIKTKAEGDSFTWDRYHSYDKIQKFIDDIIEEHKGIVTPFIIGKSYEGRDIRGIKISYKEGNRGIFLESNIHAREWITSATCTYFINELVNSQDPEIRNIAENVDWYIIPVFNVDGFVYTHEKDRLWRKTRQPTSNPNCPGTDLNRNFDTHWNNEQGSSGNPCDETYRGSAPFSEPEAKALAEYLESIKDKIGVFLTYHSYGQYILTAYGHDPNVFPENYDDIMEVAKASHDAILEQGYGTEYKYGSAASVLYIASGSSLDYTYNKLDIKMGFTFEFRDKGRYGFVLPSVNIIPNSQEVVAAMIALVKRSKELGYL